MSMYSKVTQAPYKKGQPIQYNVPLPQLGSYNIPNSIGGSKPAKKMSGNKVSK